MKRCILDAAKVCDDCHHCDDRCELNPMKICDNCFRCLDEAAGKPYAEIPIGAVYMVGADYLPGFDPDEPYDNEDAVYQKTHLSTLHGLHASRACLSAERPAPRYPRHRSST